MLRDEVLLAKADECLCHKCFYHRSIARNVPISLADLMSCPYNLLKTPLSWLDLFLSAEDEAPSPELIRECKAAIARLGNEDVVEAALQGKAARDPV